jgi:cytochrome c oxidase subunit 1
MSTVGVTQKTTAAPQLPVGESWTKLTLAHFAVAIVAFGIAAMMAVMQAMSRANTALPFRSPKMYYLSVTAHGVLMALVFTTFFIMGLGYLIARTALKRPIVSEKLGWVSFWIALAGTAAAALVILAGKATVLYTFYPPLQAHPLFYIGATLLVVGSWGWSLSMILSYRAWQKANPGSPAPLAMFGIMSSVIVWLLATAGVAGEMLFQLIPWSLGLTKTVDPVLARTLFWWFGHPLVYFWLLPAYTLWYSVLPRVAGGKLFSDSLGRLVFVMFILFSTPVGFHHQFGDPGIPAGWKLFHAMNTEIILFPSLITAFTIIASLEVAGRMRGATGLFNWIKVLPWREPFFASVALAMLTFALGGFGGAINAAYGMNAMVHNTAWIQGHFHLTVGTAVALTFMGAAYWYVPRITGRALAFPSAARMQPYLWFFGMMAFSLVNHVSGLAGMPRRVYDATYHGHPAAAAWQNWTGISALGGVVLFVSAMSFVLVMAGTWFNKRPALVDPIGYAESVDPVPTRRRLYDRIGLWTAVAVVLVIIAYAYPIITHLQSTRFGSPGFKPF